MTGDPASYCDPARVPGHALERLLPRRARPPPRVPGGERPHARLRGRRARRARPVRAPRPRRDAGRGGDPMPRPRRPRDQAPSPGAALPPRRPEAGAGLRAGRRAPVPILIHGGRGLPPIADSLGRLLDRHAPPALIVAHAGIVDLAAMARNFAGGRACSSTRRSGARSTCSTSTASCRPSRSSTPRTTRTAASPTRC